MKRHIIGLLLLSVCFGVTAFSDHFTRAEDSGEPDRQTDDSNEGELEWRRLPDLPDELGVAGPFVGLHRNALIVAGGANFPRPVWKNDKAWHDRVFVLTKGQSPRQAPTWRDGGRLSRSIAYGMAVSTTEGILCMGGNDAKQTFDDVFLMRWDPVKRVVQRESLPSLPKPCAYGQAAMIGSVVYVVGGQADLGLDSAMANFWTLDMAKRGTETFRWQTRSPFPGGRRALNLTVAHGDGPMASLYVMSGRREGPDGVVFLKDVWQFRPASEQWSRRADLPRSVMAGTAASLRAGDILVLGGADGSLFHKSDELKDRHPGFPKEALAYSTANNAWRSAGRMPANHVTTIPVLWDRRIVIASGEVRPRVRSPKIWTIGLRSN